jgi:hypothetical protein
MTNRTLLDKHSYNKIKEATAFSTYNASIIGVLYKNGLGVILVDNTETEVYSEEAYQKNINLLKTRTIYGNC